MSNTRDCCTGTEALTPESTANRPGLNALQYQVGRHATFLETMKARLNRPRLSGLQTREPGDPAVALLDAWATVADVLTFYQERIANEGYLRTATERRSVMELARLVSYRPRSGVAASVYLAFSMENEAEGIIPAGTRAQSLPGPGELPQSFETAEKITARATWNALKLRTSRPQLLRQEIIEAKGFLYFKGTNTGLEVGVPLLIDYSGGVRGLYRVTSVTAEQSANRTRVRLECWVHPSRDEFIEWFKGLASKLQGASMNLESWVNAVQEQAHLVEIPIWPYGEWFHTIRQWAENTNQPEQTTLNELKTANWPSLPLDFRAWLELEANVWSGRYPAQFNLRPGEYLVDNKLLNRVESQKTVIIEYKKLTNDLIEALRENQTNANLPNEEGLLKSIADKVDSLRTAYQTARGTLENIDKQISFFIEELLASIQSFDTAVKQLIDWLDGGDTLPSIIPSLKTILPAYVVCQNSIAFYQSQIKWKLQQACTEFEYGEVETSTLKPLDGVITNWSKSITPLLISWYTRSNSQKDSFLDLCLDIFNEEELKLQAWFGFSLQQVQQRMELKGFGDEPAFIRWLYEKSCFIQEAMDTLPSLTDKTEIVQKQGREVQRFYGFPDKNVPQQIATRIPVIDRRIRGYELITSEKILYELNRKSGSSPRTFVSVRQSQEELLGHKSDVLSRASGRGDSENGKQIYNAMRGTMNPAFNAIQIYRFGVKAPLFGHNALAKSDFKVLATDTEPVHPPTDWDSLADEDKCENTIWLDNVYNKIQPSTPIVIIKAKEDADDIEFVLANVITVEELSRSAYKISGKSTKITIEQSSNWSVTKIEDIRATTVFAQAQSLELAEMPVLNALSLENIELDFIADGLEPGRWIIVAGERTDVGGATGVQDAELAMLAKVEHIQDPLLPGDRTVTWLTFSYPLTFQFKPGTVTIYGNVVKATHGETRTEVLGSGDSSQVLQSFDLQQKPLTYLAVATAEGAQSTLETRVNDLLWHETDNLSDKGPADRSYTTRTDNEDKTRLIFGDGQFGARLPTGEENVRVKYRTGIGKAGNVDTGKITLLSTRPLGVKGVTNPMSATGGADRESRDQMRQVVPLGMRSLGRIVAVEDYANFARTFAGIGKAQAVRLINGSQTLVYVTIAGTEDIPIVETSDLFRNLEEALHRYGDPRQAVQLAVREMLTLIIDAQIQLLPDYEWESVKPKIVTRLLDQFSFERRELGQDVTRSEVISTIHKVPGVVYVDLEGLTSLTKDQVLLLMDTPEAKREQLKLLQPQYRIVANTGRIMRDETTGQIQLDPDTGRPALGPAQIAYLRPDLPEMLVINRVET